MTNRLPSFLFAFLLLAPSLPASEPVRVILDTDMASDCDDAGALAVLNALADCGEAEIVAVVIGALMAETPAKQGDAS